jgi:hypothetical protein
LSSSSGDGGDGSLPVFWEDEIPQYDDEFDRGPVPLRMVGIPRPRGTTTVYVYEPTEASRRRRGQIEAAVMRGVADGEITHTARDGFIPLDVDDGETVYVHPEHWPHYASLLEETRDIQDRSMHAMPQVSYNTERRKSRQFADGTVLEYYRRRDGALVRAVRRPSAPEKRSVIGWASTNARDHGVPEEVFRYVKQMYWRDE